MGHETRCWSFMTQQNTGMTKQDSCYQRFKTVSNITASRCEVRLGFTQTSAKFTFKENFVSPLLLGHRQSI
jgi:hypothetical protein